MTPKYELKKSDALVIGNKVMHRIVALRNFGNVKAGDLGGYIQNEQNLDHEGNCWISANAKVIESARVSQNAKVYGYAVVKGDSEISQDAHIFGNASVNNSNVSGSVMVFQDAILEDEEYFEDEKITGSFENILNVSIVTVVAGLIMFLQAYIPIFGY